MTKKQLSIQLKADDQATSKIQKLGRSFSSLGKTVRGSVKSIAAMAVSFKGLAIAAGGIFVAGRLLNSVKATAAELDVLAKNARDLGLGAEAMSTLAVAADRSGVSVQQFTSAFRRGNVALAEFISTGTGEAKDTFRNLERLGVSFQDVDGQTRSFGDILPDVSRAIGGMTDESEKLNAVSEIFGTRNGPQVLRFLSNYKDFVDEARFTGSLFTDEQLALSEGMTDAFSRVREAFRSLRVQFITLMGEDGIRRINLFAGAIAKIPEAAGNMLKLIRDAFSGGELQEAARQQFADLGDSLLNLAVGTLEAATPILFKAGFNTFGIVTRAIVRGIGSFLPALLLEEFESSMRRLANAWGDQNPVARSIKNQLTTIADGLDGAGFVLDVLNRNDAMGTFNESLATTTFKVEDFTADFEKLRRVVGNSGGEVAEIGSRILGLEPIFLKITEGLKAIEDGTGKASRASDDFAGGFADSLASAAAGIENLKEFGQQLGETLTSSFTGNFVTAIQSFQDQTKSAKEIFRDFSTSVLRDIQAIAIRAAVLNIFAGIGGAAAGPGGGIAPTANRGGTVLPSGSVRRFNVGGLVPGPNVNRDVVPALLSPGERVLSRQEARRAEQQSGGNVFNISVSVVAPTGQRPSETGRQIAQGMIEQLQRNLGFRDQMRGLLS